MPMDQARNLTWSEDLAWSSMCIAARDVSSVRDQAAFEALSASVRSEIGQACIQQSRCLDEALSAYDDQLIARRTDRWLRSGRK